MGKSAHFSGYFVSPLRYPGGKGRLGPWLASVIEKNGLKDCWYVEPYAGGAGAALYLLMQNYVEHIVISDDDPLVYAFWHSVVHKTAAFAEKIRTTPVTLESRAYFQAVMANHTAHERLEVGFAAFFLNRTSRSGILAGGVIGGKDQASNYKLDARYKQDDLISRVRAIGALRERITVVGMDALDLLIDCSHGLPEKTLIYLDPPYYIKGSQLYRNYYKHSDHAAIAHCASLIKHPLLVTYDNCPEIRALYSGMRSTEFSLQYSTHLARPFASEILFYKNLVLPTPPVLTRGAKLLGLRSTQLTSPAATA
jgi:DNA adenine methylase